MTPENFVYWLQGFFELSEGQAISHKQIQVIKNHLALVLTNVTGDAPVGKDDPMLDVPIVSEEEKSRRETAEIEDAVRNGIDGIEQYNRRHPERRPLRHTTILPSSAYDRPLYCSHHQKLC